MFFLLLLLDRATARLYFINVPGKKFIGEVPKRGSDYDVTYEYRETSDDFSSGTIDPEVRHKKFQGVDLCSHIDQVCHCGRPDLQSSDQGTRIVGGQESAPNKHPWKVLTNIVFSSLRFPCNLIFFVHSEFSGVPGKNYRWRASLWRQPDIKVLTKSILTNVL